jgi:hypothetical protein
MKRERDPLLNSTDHMMKSGYAGSDTMREFAHREFSHPNFEETETAPRSSYTAPTRDKAMPFKKGGPVKAKKSKLNDLREFKTAKRVDLKHARPELEIEIFPAPGLKSAKKEGLKRGGPKKKMAEGGEISYRHGGPTKSLMESKHPIRKPFKEGGMKKGGSKKNSKSCYNQGGLSGGLTKSLMESKYPIATPMKKGGRKMAEGGEMKRGGLKKKMASGGMTEYAMGGVGKIRHKQATSKGMPLSSLPRSKMGR